MAENTVPISQIDVGISKAELSNPQAVQALRDKAVENILAEKMDFQLHFAHILNLDEAGHFERNPADKEQLVQGARDPEYLEEIFILADDAKQVLDDSDNFTAGDQEVARQQLKDLKRVSEICRIDQMPQFSPDELDPEEIQIIRETWSKNWPVIEGYFNNYLEPPLDFTPSDNLPTIEGSPEEVSELAARLREAKEYKEEDDYGDLELVKSTKPAQAPKGPGVLRKLTGLFTRRGEPSPDVQAKQIIKDLGEAGEDETAKYYNGLIVTLDKKSLKEIAEKGIALAPIFTKGLSPDNLGELTEFSEDVTKRMEEKGILDPDEHGENIKNIRLTLWHNMKVELQNSPDNLV